MLNPINPADAKFREEWLRWYDTLPQGCAEYICCDPASTVKKKSDYTVIEKWAIDADGKHYLVMGIRDKLTSFQRIDAIVAMAKGCTNLKRVQYEVLGGRHGDLESLRKRFIEERLPVMPTETKSTNASKADRIEQRLVGQWHAGIIHLPRTLSYVSLYDGKTHDFIQDYRLEFLQFPYTEHDDILDCHSQMFEGYLARGTKDKPKPKDDEFEWWRNLARMKHRRSTVYNICRNGIKATPSYR